jgi:hypothetical protein
MMQSRMDKTDINSIAKIRYNYLYISYNNKFFMEEMYILIMTISNKPGVAKTNQSLQQYRTDILII